VLGFSAGGHLVTDISSHFDKGLYPAVDAADKESCRPDFAVALYPGHLWIGSEKFELNPDVPVTRQTPPTFLLQAEVYGSQLENIVRRAYPVIFGRSMNFALPPTAEGPSIEANINGTPIVFPLGPTSKLSWANCQVRVEKNQAKVYRCELKVGYEFR
jgi:hypothetical protein